MNALVVSGCAVAGALAGLALDSYAVRVAPAADPVDAGVEAAPGTDGPEPGARSFEPAVSETAPPDASPTVEAWHPAPAGLAERAAASVWTAVLLGAAAIRFGPVPALAPYCVLFAGLVGLSIVDIRVGLLPRKILYPTLFFMSVGLVCASAVDGSWWPIGRAAIGGFGAFFIFVVIYVLYPRGMGFGDVRLAGLMGAGLAWLGFASLYVGFLAGFFAGALYGLVAMVVVGNGRKTRFPFGPGLALGAVIGVLFGGWVASFWVLHST